MQWTELRAQVGRHQILNNEAERIMLLLHFVGAEDKKPIDQRVELAPASVVGKPWVTLWADVCASSEIEPRRALTHNATLAVGSITIDDDYYFIRHAVPLDGLTPEHLELIIELVAHEAARLRARRALFRSAEAGGVATSLYAE